MATSSITRQHEIKDIKRFVGAVEKSMEQAKSEYANDKKNQIAVITKWLNSGWRVTQILSPAIEDGERDGWAVYKPGDKIMIELTREYC